MGPTEFVPSLCPLPESGPTLESFVTTVFGVDNECRVAEWNEKAASITGYSTRESIGENLVERFVAPELRSSVQRVFQNALDGQETSNFELALVTKTGRRVVVLLNATTRRNAEGAVVGVVGIGQDVTAMRLAEDKARQYAGEYSERLCRSFDLSLDLVTQVDLAGLAPQIYYASPSFETVLGHPPSDVLGDYVQLRWLFPPSFFEHLPSITTQMRSGDDGCTVEYPMLHADGREVETRRWNPSFACCWLACLLLAGLRATCFLSFFLSFSACSQLACQ